MTDPPAPAATVARALLASLVRHALTVAGTALVTRGLVDQGTVDGYMATAVEMVVGAMIVAESTAWGQFRAFWSQTRWTAAWKALRGGGSPEAGPTPGTVALAIEPSTTA